MSLQQTLKKLIEFEELSEKEMTAAMHEIISGRATPAQIAGFLVGMEMKTPTITELTTATKVMREASARIKTKFEPLLDIVGTGGDDAFTFNISTTSSFVVAAAGGIVAKHGNRAVSSLCGSADILEHAGLNLNLNTQEVIHCLAEVGIGFLFAPSYHHAMQYAAAPRHELGIRTFFNLLGPLCNPANATHIVMGVYDQKWLLPAANVLKNLACHRAMIVHSQDGLDEISIAAPTDIVELHHGEITNYTIYPEEYGLAHPDLTALQAVNIDQSLSLMKQVLQNTMGAARDVIILNAGAAIYVSELAPTLAQGIDKATEVLASGKAWQKFEELIAFSQHKARTP